jgi:hypothetical protein
LVPKLKNDAWWAISSAVRAPRGHLDHRAELVVHGHAGGRGDRVGLRLQQPAGLRQLVHVAHERDHDLRDRVPARLLHRDLRVEDRAGLDLHEVRDHEPEAAAAQAEHRVLLAHGRGGGSSIRASA